MSESPTPAPSPVALRQRREQTIAALCEHFARDVLEMEELEQRLDAAHRATSLEELAALVQDLPSRADGAPAGETLPAPRASGGEPSLQDHQLVVAFMGGAERRGGWAPARNVHVVALMGGAVLDFREAHLDPGVTEVTVLAVMGGVEILVPPGVHVDSSGIGIMGGFEHVAAGRPPVDTSLPVLRIRGVALMGGVEVSRRLPGERAREARLRLREERRLGRG